MSDDPSSRGSAPARDLAARDAGGTGRRILRWSSSDVACVAVALVPALFTVLHLRLPLHEDGLFWWVPAALWHAERGLALVPDGGLPDACLPWKALPPQWGAGLPDYGHPPLWYWYLALWIRVLGPQAWVVHLSCVPVALAVGFGVKRLAERLAVPGWPLGLLVVLASPPVLAQMLRPDSDLALLGTVLWSLVALVERKPWSFVGVSLVACWIKEPAVFLAVPALVAGWEDRRFLGAALAPLLGGVVWAGLHWIITGWALAGAERLPGDLPAFGRDLASVGSLVFVAQGRWLLTAGLAAWGLLRWFGPRRRDAVARGGGARCRGDGRLLGAFVLSQVLLFSGLNFLGGRDVAQTYTHVRYLLPALVVFPLLVLPALSEIERNMDAGRRPRIRWLVRVLLPAAILLQSSWGIRTLEGVGPEVNLFMVDQVAAWRGAVDPVRQAAVEGPVRVESYLFTALTRPFAGLVDDPPEGILPFGPATLPEEVAVGTVIVTASYGEPLSRLGELNLRRLRLVQAGDAWVALDRVEVGRTAAPPRGAGPMGR